MFQTKSFKLFQKEMIDIELENFDKIIEKETIKRDKIIIKNKEKNEIK